MVADADRAASSAARLRTRGALRGAVGRGEITVAFQPIVELANGTIHGFEALARWQHPELGAVAPAEFIPVAEASGEIVLIGEHVLHIQVVAEGIETQRQRELLRLSGCPFGQGFLFAPPLPPEEIVIGRRRLRPTSPREMLRSEARLAASPMD